MLQKIARFFSYTIWTYPADSYGKVYQVSLKYLRIFISSTFKFYKQEGFVRVASLAYYTINSLVPLLALMIWITARFAIKNDFQNILIELQPNQQEFINMLFTFSDNMLNSISNGLFFLVGVGFLLWSVFSLMNNIENAINSVWSMTKDRHIGHKIVLHFMVILILPFVLFLSVSITVAMRKGVMDFINNLDVFKSTLNYGAKLIFIISNYAILSLLFSSLYLLFPYRKVKWKSAFIGGLVAGILFFLFQELYVQSQIGVSRTSAIFGGFAALPLFFLWLYISWGIILYGVYLSYHVEYYPLFTNIKKEKISFVKLKQLSLGIYRTIEKKGEKQTLRALHRKELAQVFVTSIKQMDMALQYLKDAQLIKEYKPIVSTYSLYDLNKKYTDKQICDKIDKLYEDDVVLVVKDKI